MRFTGRGGEKGRVFSFLAVKKDRSKQKRGRGRKKGQLPLPYLLFGDLNQKGGEGIADLFLSPEGRKSG